MRDPHKVVLPDFSEDTDTLPNEPAQKPGRTNIQDILKNNPDVEAKRKANHAKAMQGNINNLKHGEFSASSLSPFFRERLTRYDDIQFKNNPEAIQGVKRVLVHEALRRLALYQMREAFSDNESPDPQVTKLTREAYAMLSDLERSEKTAAAIKVDM